MAGPRTKAPGEKPRNKPFRILRTNGELMDDVKDAITIMVKEGRTRNGAAKAAKVEADRLAAALRDPVGQKWLRQCKRVVALPPVLCREELLDKLAKAMDREDAKVSEVVAAVGLYARITGVLDGSKIVVQQNTVNVAADVPFSAVLQGIAEKKGLRIECENVTSAAIDV